MLTKEVPFFPEENKGSVFLAIFKTGVVLSLWERNSWVIQMAQSQEEIYISKGRETIYNGKLFFFFFLVVDFVIH